MRRSNAPSHDRHSPCVCSSRSRCHAPRGEPTWDCWTGWSPDSSCWVGHPGLARAGLDGSRMSGPILLVLGTLLVTQAAVVATSVYLHRGLAHRALTLHPLADWVFRLVLWISTEPAGMGGGAPEAPCLHRHRARSPPPTRARVLEDPALERLLLRPRSAQSRNHRPLGQGHPDRRVGPRPLRPGRARWDPGRRGRHAGAGPRPGAAPGGRPLRALRVRPGAVDQRPGPLAGAKDLQRQLGHQPSRPRVADRWGEPPQQPPRPRSSAWPGWSSTRRGW
jgi:hypothetical protein